MSSFPVETSAQPTDVRFVTYTTRLGRCRPSSCLLALKPLDHLLPHETARLQRTRWWLGHSARAVPASRARALSIGSDGCAAWSMAAGMRLALRPLAPALSVGMARRPRCVFGPERYPCFDVFIRNDRGLPGDVRLRARGQARMESQWFGATWGQLRLPWRGGRSRHHARQKCVVCRHLRDFRRLLTTLADSLVMNGCRVRIPGRALRNRWGPSSRIVSPSPHRRPKATPSGCDAASLRASKHEPAVRVSAL
jgi:hypothetical protein